MDVLVLNADFGPLHRVSLCHAVRMLVRRVVEVHEPQPDRLVDVYPVPTVVRLVFCVVTRWRHGRSPGRGRACWPVTAGTAATAAGPPRRSTTCCRARAAAPTPGSTPWPPAAAATSARGTGPRPRRACPCGPLRLVPTWVALSLRWDRPAGHHPAGRDGS